jgi:alpha-beta hydrolase superfamily lysophospholipase
MDSAPLPPHAVALGFSLLALGLLLLLFVRTALGPYTSGEHSFVPSAGTATRKQRAAYSSPAGYFLNKDHLYIAYRVFGAERQPAQPPKAVVLIVHGVGEHSGRYEALAETLRRECGAACLGLDHQGHGKSEGDRLFVRDFEDYVQDVLQLSDYAKALDGATVPQIILGHSLGGLVSIRTFEKEQKRFVGAIFSAPALAVDASDLERKLAPWLSSKLPKLQMNKIDPNLLSHDPSVVDKYVNDPLCVTHGVTARLGDEVLQAIDRALAYAEEITTPYLLLRGTADKITFRQGVVDFHAKTKSVSKTFVEIPDYYHEIFNEKDSIATKMVVSWLKERLAGA